MARRRILVVFGTRPEAIKLCPLVRTLAARGGEFEVRTCVTGQHRAMLDQVLGAFCVSPDYDLDLMRPGQALGRTVARILEGMEHVLLEEKPDIVVVQGDTNTTFAAALAAFYEGYPVAHVEAGLRTGNKRSPFPEEMNRLLTTRLASLHLAATEWAADNLRTEGVAEESIVVTGNTVIDAALHIRAQLESGALPRPEWPRLDPAKKTVLVTAHRRESFGAGFERICQALKALASRDDVHIIYPVHRNPNVLDPVREALSGQDGIELVEPLEYVPFVDLMSRCYLILTDSGGIQEEAPSLGKPVLVMRENTERPEAIEAGTALLVGTQVERIVGEATRLLDDPERYDSMARRHNPYGDGKACQRIADELAAFDWKNGAAT
jgi:UDP-N-acetylglucosamine 2-epimerase (non-hydrolysing)